MSLRRKIFYGFTLALIATLLVLPSTGWLARLQLLSFLPSRVNRITQSSFQKGKVDTDRFYRDVAQQQPADWQIQFAYAMLAKDNNESIRRLESLNEHAAGNPVILSATLRLMTSEQVKMNRTEENLLSVPRKDADTIKVPTPSDPATVAKFIALAEEGERVAPNNAYFPMMATVGYFAAHKDDAAATAWLRASEKPIWDDYTSEESTAKWKMLRAMNGGNEYGAIGRMSTMAAVLYPHFAPIRGAGRLAAVEAILAEQAGDKEKGFALRQATRKNGQLMQAQGKSYIASLVGRAITFISASRPGGAEAMENPYKGEGSSGRWMKEKQEHYKAYLTSIGHTDEVTAFSASVAQGEALRKVWSDGNGLTIFGFGSKTIQYFGVWCADALLLTGVLFSLAFGGIFKLVYRFSPRLQHGEPLQSSAKWGVVNGIGGTLIGAAMAISAQSGIVYSELICWSGFAVIVLLLLVPPILMRFAMQQLLHGLAVTLATLAACAGLVAAGAVALLMFGGVVQSFGVFSYGANDSSQNPYLAMIIAGGLVLLVPLALLGLFGIFSTVLSVPFASGVTRGMRAMAVPFAAFLLLLWSITFLVTLQYEHRAIAEMEQMASIGEIQTIASLLHRPLPN